MTAASRFLAISPHGRGGMLAAALGSLLFCQAAVAQPARVQPPEDGLFVTVNSPITTEVVNRVRNTVEEARAGKSGRTISKVVFDFNPNGREASTQDFGVCYDLAKYIKNLHTVVTIAHVHYKVSRHTVLPVLACKEVVMGSSDSSWIGPIVDDPKTRLEPQDAKVYEQLAGEARAAIVQNMPDPEVEWMKARRNNAEFSFANRSAPTPWRWASWAPSRSTRRASYCSSIPTLRYAWACANWGTRLVAAR